MNVCAKQKETHIENKLMVTKGEREGECKLGVWDYEIRVCVCVCVASVMSSSLQLHGL